MEITQQQLSPGLLAIVIILPVVLAGIAHTIWLGHPISTRFKIPIDSYCLFRGKRIFGDNKTLRGFMIMIPATGLFFLLIGVLNNEFPDILEHKIWQLSPINYGQLGFLAGFGFMAGELPNSFLKRQLGIAPGDPPPRKWYRPIILLLDRTDSIVGLLIVVSFAVPIPWRTWVYILLFGPFIHLLFSAWLYFLKVKKRPA